MATQYYMYTDDAGTEYGVPLTDAQQALYTAIVGTLPASYASLAAFQVANPSAVAYPAGLAARYFNVTSAFFGTAQIVVLSTAQFDALFPTGTTPFPTTPVSFTDPVAISGASGEQRMSN